MDNKELIARSLYPEYASEDGSFYGPSNYQPIIDSFGKVLIQVDDSDYQGDTRVILEKDGKFGWLNFGWGSCSGCDSLQACNSYSDIERLINDLRGSIKWYDSYEDLRKYFQEKDWELEYSWHAAEQKQFIQRVIEYDTSN
jgi:hypothetical protein